MSDRFIFADGAGCFTFERKPNVSRYFILCTVTMLDCEEAATLADLRRRLVWDKAEIGDCFHATEDKQAVRNAVYEAILGHRFEIQATILEKSKAMPHVRTTRADFYKYPWYYHFRYGISRRVHAGDRLLVTAASLGNRKERAAFSGAIHDVVRQTIPQGTCAVDFRPAAADPSLQVADYCAWAIQRKWETGKKQAYNIIKDRITYEYDLWSRGEVHYY